MNMEKEKIKELVSQMTLEEKVSFCTGKGFWNLQGLERLGIPSIFVTDGPHGLRKQEKEVDHLGISESEKAICYPAGCALAASFDPELAEKAGSEIGALAQAENIGIVLGPAMNIKRSPLCGRNFEYYSEDPLLSGKIAAGMVKGIQKNNVGACPKHYLANNQEFYRNTSNSIVDEQTMREIYLAGFEIAVKEAKPWSIMSSYNRINGVYASENKTYLTDILRKEWGFDGFVMTDWGACNDAVQSIIAGLDLEMPGPCEDNQNSIRKAIEAGELDEALLDQAVVRILNVVFQYVENHKKNVCYRYEKGHAVSGEIESECAILLKNVDSALPLQKKESVAFIGKYVKSPRYQGGGSSHINSYRVSSVWDMVKDREGVSYALGFEDTGLVREQDERLLKEAVEVAKKVDKAVIFAGLPDVFESEGIDRSKLSMPENQNRLIEAVSKVQPNTIVVLHNGAPVTMPWLSSVKAVLEMYLGGEAVGIAASDLLYGKVNPSGRLAETFPIRIEDTPTFPYYGVEKDDVIYREGNLIGYRYYQTMKKDVLFPFGHGLSYTTFAYSNLSLDKKALSDNEVLRVSVDVTNTGDFFGKEVVQLYISAPMKNKVRPDCELRAFRKISLNPNETKMVTFELSGRAFAEWKTEIHDWYTEPGIYRIQVKKNASVKILEEEVMVYSSVHQKPHFTINSPMGDLWAYPAAVKVLEKATAELKSHSEINTQNSADEGILSQEAATAIEAAMTLRSMLSFVPGVKKEQLEKIIEEVNAAVENEQ